jgi:hypothetical protein
MAAVSYMPSSHADDSGAFSPLIKWIQEYGTVPGIANLDARFGYNSSWFILQALYGFAFLKVGYFNDLNGLLFLYLLLYSFQGIDGLLKGHTSFINYLRSFFFLPVVFLYFGFSHDIILYSIQFFTSPTYDIPVTFIMWIVFFMFLGLKEVKGAVGTSIYPYLIVLYIAYLITVKLNAVPLILLGFFILWNLVLNKHYNNTIVLCVGGAVIIIPWVAKTIISCGYILFPFAELDILNVDWKLPKESVMYIENSVITWAIDPDVYGGPDFTSSTKHFSVPIKEWFPVWYSHINYINSIIFFAALMVTVYFLGWLVWQVVKNKWHFFSKYSTEVILLLTLLAGIGLWFTKGPLFRYGYGYLVFYCIFALSLFIFYFLRDFRSEYIGIAVLVYFTYAVVYYHDNLWGPVRKTFGALPRKREAPEYVRSNSDRGHFINVVKGDACDNAPVPCSPGFVYEYLRAEYRGATIKEGFRSRLSETLPSHK